MKQFNLKGSTYIDIVPFGKGDWYYSTELMSGDLYEAEEIYREEGTVKGNTLYLISFPEGKVHEPFEREQDVYCGNPVYDDGKIWYVRVWFKEGTIRVFSFDTETYEVKEETALPLSDVKDCYNLLLHPHPVLLSRQNSKTFEALWPEKIRIEIAPNESFFYREEDRFYFNVWFEDPEYREETWFRDPKTGEVFERIKGDVMVMPDGQKWHLK